MDVSGMDLYNIPSHHVIILLTEISRIRVDVTGMTKRVNESDEGQDEDQIKKLANIKLRVLPALLNRAQEAWNTYLSMYNRLTPEEQEEVWTWKDGRLAYMKGCATFDEIPIDKSLV